MKTITIPMKYIFFPLNRLLWNYWKNDYGSNRYLSYFPLSCVLVHLQRFLKRFLRCFLYLCILWIVSFGLRKINKWTLNPLSFESTCSTVYVHRRQMTICISLVIIAWRQWAWPKVQSRYSLRSITQESKLRTV